MPCDNGLREKVLVEEILPCLSGLCDKCLANKQVGRSRILPLGPAQPWMGLRIRLQAGGRYFMDGRNEINRVCPATGSTSTDESAMESKECEEKDEYGMSMRCAVVTRRAFGVDNPCLLPADWLPWASITRLLGGFILAAEDIELSLFPSSSSCPIACTIQAPAGDKRHHQELEERGA